MDLSVSGTIDQEIYLKNIRGASAPLAPWIRLWPAPLFNQMVGHFKIISQKASKVTYFSQ